MSTRESLTVPLSADMLDQLDRLSKEEKRTRAELMREALAWYLRMPLEEPTAEEVEAIRAGREAIARGDHVTLDEVQDDLDADRRSPR